MHLFPDINWFCSSYMLKTHGKFPFRHFAELQRLVGACFRHLPLADNPASRLPLAFHLARPCGRFLALPIHRVPPSVTLILDYH